METKIPQHNQLPEMPAMESDGQEAARLEKIAAESAERQAKKEALRAQGYSGSEVSSISGEGYIQPALYAREDPSRAAIEAFARNENLRNAERVGLGEDVSVAPEGYQEQRQKLIEHRLGEQYTPEEAVRIVEIGHGMPEQYDPHFYGQMLEAMDEAAKPELVSV